MGAILEGRRKETRRQRARRALVKKIFMIRPKKILEASKRPCRAVHRRVETLRELVPNSTHESSEGTLDGLFRQTADYILDLEMKVRVMQTMLQLLTHTTDSV